MAKISIGLDDVLKISIGDTPVLKVSIGDELVFPPPSPSGLAAVEFFDMSTAGNSVTITLPETTQAGDVVVVLNRATAGSTPAEVYPSGFAPLIASQSTLACRFCASYKIMTEEDISSGRILTCMSATGAKQIWCGVYRGFSSIEPRVESPISAVEPVGQAKIDSNKPTDIFMDIAGNSANSPANASLALYSSSGTVTTRTWQAGGPDDNYDSELMVNNLFYVAVKQNKVGSMNFNIGMADNGNNNTLCGLILKFT